MSAASFKADHGSVKSNNEPHGVSWQFSKIQDPQEQPGHRHQTLRYINDTTCRSITEALQDPSHVPSARCQISLDNPPYCVLSHDNKSAPPHKNLLAEIGAQFSDHQQGTVRPAQLDSADIAS